LKFFVVSFTWERECIGGGAGLDQGSVVSPESHKRHFTSAANHLGLSGFCSCVFAWKIARQNNPSVLAFYMARHELPEKSDFVGRATVIQNDVSKNRCQRTKAIKGASTAQLTI